MIRLKEFHILLFFLGTQENHSDQVHPAILNNTEEEIQVDSKQTEDFTFDVNINEHITQTYNYEM